MNNISCPLCLYNKSKNYHKDKKREYQKCLNCQLIFVEKKHHLDLISEKERYNLHNNNNNDLGYIKFLTRIIDPLEKFIAKNSKGLDFGSGPNPVLAELLKEKGYQIRTYDIFYEDNQKVFLEKYDFIISTEVFEHLYEPNKVIKKLISKINNNGYLALMTGLVESLNQFTNWYYKNDLTHVCFFSLKTFKWLENEFNLKIVFKQKDIIILRKL